MFYLLIANYNNGKFFFDCYQSILSQTSSSWKVIIIDDCSTDNSRDLIKDIILDDKRFVYIENKENLGYQRTLIKAINYIDDEALFARIDPDDTLAPKAIEISIKVHLENPEVGLVYSDMYFCDEKLNVYEVHKAKQIDSLDSHYYNFKGEISHFASFKKSIFNLTSGIDPFIKRAEDKDIFMKMCEVAPVKHIDKPLYYYRIHKGGASTFSNSEKAQFWHWVALIKMAERRKIEIEELFVDYYINRQTYEKVLNALNKYQSNPIIKLMHKLRLF